MDKNGNEYLNVISGVSFLEHSERDFSMDVEEARSVGDLTPDQITTNLGGGDNVVPNLEDNDELLNEYLNRDSSSNTDRYLLILLSIFYQIKYHG